MTQGNLTNSVQNKFLTYNNKKKMSSAFKRVEGKFPVKGSYEDSGIATGLITGELKQYFICF